MTTLLLITGLALLGVAFSVGRDSWRGKLPNCPLVPVFILATLGLSAASIFLAFGGG